MRRFDVFALGTKAALLALVVGCKGTGPRTSEDARGPESAAGSPGRNAASSSTEPSKSPAGGSALIERSACGLPLFGTAGQLAPTGTADGIEVLDWAGATFAVSFTFDDSNSSQISAYSDLRALRVPMTFYLQTGKEESLDPVWVQALADGHELGNHTERHLQTAEGPDIDAATTFIQKKFGVAPLTMAAPYGSTTYVPFAQERFFINRGTPGGTIAPLDASNPFNLPCYVPDEGATAAAMNAVMDAARSAGVWQISLVHGFIGGTDAAYRPIELSEFLAHVEYTKALQGVWIDTVVTVGAYFLGQKAVAEARRTTEGAATTWTWTLPKHFPSDRCVRVRVKGGTLAQAGKPLPWNEHGYYEVALDAGALTLTP